MSNDHVGVPLEDVAVQDERVSRAVEDPFRAMILDMLADDAMTAGEIHDEVTRRGFDRTENTIRHHVNELRDTGLVEVAAYEEGRGGTKKYYSANTFVLAYRVPDGHDDALDELVDAATPAVRDLLDDLRTDHGDAVDELAGAMSPCAHCETQKYETYVLLTALRRGFVRAHRDDLA